MHGYPPHHRQPHHPPHPADPRMMQHQHHYHQQIHPAGYEQQFEPPRHLPHYEARRSSPYATYPAPPAGYHPHPHPHHPHHAIPPRPHHPAGYQPRSPHHAYRHYHAPSPRQVPAPHLSYMPLRLTPSHDAVPSATVSVTSASTASSASPPPIVPSISASSSSSELIDLASSTTRKCDDESQTSATSSKVEAEKHCDDRPAPPRRISSPPKSKKERLLARMATPSPQPASASTTVSAPVTPPRSLFQVPKTEESSPSTPTSTTSSPPSTSSSPSSPSKWTEAEDAILRQAVTAHSARNWKKIAQSLPNRSDVQCLHRWQKVLRPGLVKGPWTAEEDQRLVQLVTEHGVKRWSFLAKELDSGRLGKQCRERWYNHLDPNINKGAWTRAEDDAIVETYQKLGSKWAQIARAVGNGRTDNAIKNRWNSTLKKVVSGEIGRPCYDGEDACIAGKADAVSGNDTAAVVSRKRSREPPSPTSVKARAIDDIDYDLLSKDRSTCTPDELDRMRRERNRMHARKSRERKRARAEAEAAGTTPNYAKAEYVRKVSTATPPPALENQMSSSALSTPSTLASTIKSIRSDLSDDDAIAAEALSTLTTSSPLPRPNLIMSYSSDDSSTVTPAQPRREEVSAESMVDLPGLAVPTLPKTNNGEEDAVGLLLHFNNQTKSLQCHAAATKN